MIHATQKALDKLELLLAEIRKFSTLKEKKRGCFYHKSNAFLHFHEDPTGFYADVMMEDRWERFSVNNKQERDALLRTVAEVLT